MDREYLPTLYYRILTDFTRDVYKRQPASTSAADPLQQTVTKQNDGAFYLNITGELKYTGTGKVDANTYNAQRSRVRAAADSGADVTVYGGLCDITTPTVQDSLTWNGSYRFMNRDGASVVLLAASQGIRKTDPSQYGRFKMCIRDRPSKLICSFSLKSE